MTVNQYIELAESLKKKRAEHENTWRALRDYIMPRKEGDADPNRVGDAIRKKPCSVATDAAQILAAAHLTYITPIESRWFKLKPHRAPSPEARSSLEQWYSKFTEVQEEDLKKSNFYSAIHEVYIDRVIQGTGCMFAEMGNDGLCFNHIPMGTFAIAENAYGQVDTLVRWFTLTAHQSEQMFGRDKLSHSVRAALEKTDSAYAETFQYIQCVIPRQTSRKGEQELPAELRPWEDVYICVDDKEIVQTGGFYEFPFLVTRFLRWGNSPYGYPPGKDRLDDIKIMLDVMELMLSHTRKSVDPRILALAEQVGEIDLRAGGQTIIAPEHVGSNFPKEWATVGRLDHAERLLELTKKSIEDAFHKRMVQIFDELPRQITATEAIARQNEKLPEFTPSFAQFVWDFRPLMFRIFSLTYRRAKALKDPLITSMPDGVLEASTNGSRLPIPGVDYLGKIALTVSRERRSSTISAIGDLASVAQASGDPSVMDAIKMDEAAKVICESHGVPADVMRTLGEMEEERKKREQQQQEAIMLAAQEAQSKINSNNAQALTALQQ